MMRYPLNLRFKIAAIASQIYVNDADGNQIFYVKQKLFKLKENIEIYTDSSKTQKLYTVKADRVIDFSPEFILRDSNEVVLGSVKRFGRKSIWKSNYDLKIGQSLQFKVTETNPWVKVIDSLISEIPLIGLVSAYFFHPEYQVSDQHGQTVASFKKLPALFEGKYTLENKSLESEEKTHNIFAALIMVVVLRERFRG
jgi:uncharacterized protein YxjI